MEFLFGDIVRRRSDGRIGVVDMTNVDDEGGFAVKYMGSSVLRERTTPAEVILLYPIDLRFQGRSERRRVEFLTNAHVINFKHWDFARAAVILGEINDGRSSLTSDECLVAAALLREIIYKNS